jgi:hypothetical protein
MTRSKIFAALVAMALAVPAVAEDPGVFKVPGTDSTIKLYGFVQLDTTLDFSGRVGNIEENDWATILPAVPDDDSPEADQKKPQLYLTARTSRFGIQTSTPTKVGNVGIRLEGDFNGPNADQSETFTNSVVFRLRHAYGTVGGLLLGQTWTTFLDLGAYPDVVDFNGPGTIALVRNPMARYTLKLAPGATLALAAENARGAQFGGTKFQTLPDFHANLTYGAKWGHVSVRAVTQQFNEFLGAADPATKFGFAGAASGSFKVGGDTLVAQFAGGPGIGRYLLNSLGTGGSGAGAYTLDANDELDLWTVLGYHVGYTHVWNSQFRSNVVWAQTFIQDAKVDGVEADNGVQKELMQAFVNTFWSFAKNAQLGVEYSYGQWKSFTNGTPERTGTQNRVNANVNFSF